MITVSNPPSTVSVPVATTGAEGKTKVDNNMTGDPVAITTHSIGIPSGVAELDDGGLVPVEELPLDVAYTDVANIFTRTQTIGNYPDEGSQITADGIDVSSTPNDTHISINGVFILGLLSGMQMQSNDDGLYGALQLNSTGVDLTINSLIYSSMVGPIYAFNGPATNIHQDIDGTIHLQTAPTGMAGGDITWTDALTINNDGTSIIEDSFGNFTQFGPGSITLQATDGTSLELTPNTESLQANDPVWQVFTATDTNSSGIIADTNNGFDIAGNSISTGVGTYTYYKAGKATRIHQDGDGTIHLQTAPTGIALADITWADAFIINADGTIDLSATPTTTTAPAAGMADALPILPTGYATIDIGGTPRQIAYY